ncbi:MAG: F0F1 ATP synthase subunit A [Thermoleophilia bacterium]
MEISPDEWVLWSWHGYGLTATVVYTWLVMVILVVGSWLLTRRLSDEGTPSRWQNAVEVVIAGVRDQIHEISGQAPSRYLPFIGTLFLFIATSNLLAVVPGFKPPTGSLSTTTALALCVLVAVPTYGIIQRGVGGYLRGYVKPTPLMLPFNVLGEITRTIALAIRLYGNIMSGTVIVAILLGLTPFLFPLVMQLLGLLTGMIQAYIFAVLATVYIASASQSAEETAARAGGGPPSAPPAPPETT